MEFDGLEVPAICFGLDDPTGAITTTGGFSTVILYVALGDNRVLFMTGDDTAKTPAVRADIVRAQLRKVTAQASSASPSATG